MKPPLMPCSLNLHLPRWHRALGLWLILLSQPPAADTPQATVCIDHYPPFTYFVQHEARGAMLDALRQLGKEVGFELRVSANTAFARCLRMMEAGKMDLMVSLMPTPERLQYMRMFPYADPEALRLVARADFPREPANIMDVLALRVGLINGYQYPPDFTHHPAAVQAPKPEAGLRLLDADRIDLLVLNESVASHLVNQPHTAGAQRGASYKLLKAAFWREQNVNSIGVSKKSWLNAHSQAIGDAIASMRERGDFARYIRAHEAHLQQQP